MVAGGFGSSVSSSVLVRLEAEDDSLDEEEDPDEEEDDDDDSSSLSDELDSCSSRLLRSADKRAQSISTADRSGSKHEAQGFEP